MRSPTRSATPPGEGEREEEEEEDGTQFPRVKRKARVRVALTTRERERERICSADVTRDSAFTLVSPPASATRDIPHEKSRCVTLPRIIGLCPGRGELRSARNEKSARVQSRFTPLIMRNGGRCL
jgi:hypothetical protein